MIHSEGMATLRPDQIKGGEVLRLPPGYRFHPTDDELVGYHLAQKVAYNTNFEAIGEVDFNKCEPWDLPRNHQGNQSMLYFFSLRDRKYPTGMRTNRATAKGYWKATGKDREVVHKTSNRLLGMKKTLVFYTGRAPKGERTSWIMHEYRLETGETADHQQEWVVCRIFFKSSTTSKKMAIGSTFDTGSSSTYEVSHTADLSTDQTCSFEQALPELRSPSSHLPELYTLSEPQGHFYQGSTSLAGREAAHLRRSNNSMKGRREPQLGDTLDNLLSNWDMGSPVPNWDDTLDRS